ncbi:hypothetical protein BGZ59_006480 [Podila verticillata]|nr:hypothetical protein BGZ59_006480 [Podila verticillata]KFH67894.1 hypothetical protein MVEG_06625 [Podila verticillata NRRL 6337]
MSQNGRESPPPHNHRVHASDSDDDDAENEAFLSFSAPTAPGTTSADNIVLNATYHSQHDNGNNYGQATLSNSEISALDDDDLPEYPRSSASFTRHKRKDKYHMSNLSSSSSSSSSASTITPTTATTTETCGATASSSSSKPSKWSTIGHQICFLATGIFSTIAVQWLYYQGAASGSSMLTVFFNYIGMMFVGLIFAFQTWYADRKQRKQAMAASAGVEYDVLMDDVLDPKDASGTSLARRKHVNEEYSEEEEEDEEDSEQDAEKQRLRMSKKKKGRLASSSSPPSKMGSEAKPHWARLHWPVIQVAVMDVIANALVTIGFFYVGSGMYQVIYSSIVIWCAILTRIFLSRKLNNVQWVAIVGVTMGLAVSAVGTVQNVSSDGAVQSWLEKSFGALITLGATFLYACVYVLSDKVLSTFEPKPIPEKVCSMVGGYASLLTLVYLCVYTFPNWQTEVVDLVKTHDGNWLGILFVYPLLTISSMLHSLNYYVLLSRINNIAVGILQSLRAVLVFVMSHYMYCGISSTQCFNQWKFLSAIIVIGCVTLFSFNSAPSTPPSQGSSTAEMGEMVEPLALHQARHSRSASPSNASSIPMTLVTSPS